MNTKIILVLILSFFFSFIVNAQNIEFEELSISDDLSSWVLPINNIWWSLNAGVLNVKNGPDQKGSILWTKKSFQNFIIELEFLMGKGTVDSGIFLRNDKQQIQIGESGSLKRDMTGSIYIPGKGYPGKAAGMGEILKKKEWNKMKIMTVGNVYTVWVNEIQVLKYESAESFKEGPIGLQLHPNREMEIDFKKIKIGELSPSILVSKKTENRVQLVPDNDKNKVDVFIDGKLFTSYIYPSSIKKPVLYPLITPAGSRVTRKYPLEPSAGERVDHPHQVGVWFNYGDVNGLDFWNNSDAIAEDKRSDYGTITHKSVNSIKSGKEVGILDVTEQWMNEDGDVLLQEDTRFVFGGSKMVFYIDRITKLTAKQEIDFKDNKEGVLGIRVSRALEHPSDKPSIYTDSEGNPTKIAVLDNDGVNGNYINAEGIEGMDVWAKRSDWVNLRSRIGTEKISLAILDHKDNVGYPTYWHARGYGLFAANPLGQEVFSEGKESLNFRLEKDESTTFRHRIIVASTDLSANTLNSKFTSFSSKQ